MPGRRSNGRQRRSSVTRHCASTEGLPVIRPSRGDQHEMCYGLRIYRVAAVFGLNSEASLGEWRSALLNIAEGNESRLGRGGIDVFGYRAAPRHQLTEWHHRSYIGSDCSMDVIRAIGGEGLEAIHSRHAHAVVLASHAATSRYRRLPSLRQRRECAGQQEHQHRNGDPTPHE